MPTKTLPRGTFCAAAERAEGLIGLGAAVRGEFLGTCVGKALGTRHWALAGGGMRGTGDQAPAGGTGDQAPGTRGEGMSAELPGLWVGAGAAVLGALVGFDAGPTPCPLPLGGGDGGAEWALGVRPRSGVDMWNLPLGHPGAAGGAREADVVSAVCWSARAVWSGR